VTPDRSLRGKISSLVTPGIDGHFRASRQATQKSLKQAAKYNSDATATALGGEGCGGCRFAGSRAFPTAVRHGLLVSLSSRDFVPCLTDEMPNYRGTQATGCGRRASVKKSYR
jgi:hypothetical protein